MAVKIEWQEPLVLELRKMVQWENIIRYELGELEGPLDVSLRFEEEKLRWKVDATSPNPSKAAALAETRGRVVQALRAAGKPVA
jgi:hypothetical protein